MNEDVWKRRFFIFTAVRLAGLAVFLFGLAVTFNDILRPGGWPLVGSILMIAGLVDAVVAPKMLRRQWERQDREQR